MQIIKIYLKFNNNLNNIFLDMNILYNKFFN